MTDKIFRMLEEVTGTNDMFDTRLLQGSVKWDYELRNANIEDGRELCKKCDGTGNELFMNFRKCGECDGTGEVV